MPFLHSRVLDHGLVVLSLEVSRLVLLNRETNDYHAATEVNRIGQQIAPPVSMPGDRQSGGRQVLIGPIEDGEIITVADATHYALLDDANGRVLACAEIANKKLVVTGSRFSLNAFQIGIPSP